MIGFSMDSFFTRIRKVMEDGKGMMKVNNQYAQIRPMTLTIFFGSMPGRFPKFSYLP